MALRYWVGGNGTWNNSTTTNWSATSGGAGGASAPTANDDVIFNAASSAGSYVVSCFGSSTTGLCKSITTTAPATGTLTFSAPNNDNYFNVFSGDVNIHAGCLFSDFGAITHAPTTAGTYTVTFNSPGTNTQRVSYVFNQASASTTLNFCNSNTATFRGMSLSVGGTFICTNATLTNSATGGSLLSSIFGGGATSVTMTGTTLNMNGDPSTSVTIGGSTTTTWAVSTLALSLTNFGNFATPDFVILSFGQNASTQPASMGAVSFTNCAGSAWFARASTLTLTGGIVTLLTGLTTSGALTATGTLINPGFSVSISGTTTLTGAGTYRSTSNSASTTFVGAATAADGGFSNQGSLTFSNGLTITPTGTNVGALQANVILADALALTNTFLTATTSLTVNGGVGKAFSYTVNANPLPVSGLYPFISATSASITTPTTSFVGTNVRRVVYGQPRSSTKTVNDTLTISGSTPTLTNVTFLGTTINGGGSNFLGTRLGTDGLSSGFLAAAGVQKFLVATPFSSVAYDSAIWALTSGGATSADNYPLPQDTVIFNSVSDGAVVTYAGQIHIGSVTMPVTNGTLLSGSAPVFCYGDIVLTGAGSYFCNSGPLQIAQSGNTNRYLTKTQIGADVLSSSNGSLIIDPGNITLLAVSGAFRALGSLSVRSGDNDYLTGTQFGWNNNYLSTVSFTGGTNTMRATEFYTPNFSIGLGTVFPSSNYTVEASSLNTPTFVYANAAPTTALNGSLRFLRTNVFVSSATITGTTATNPLKSLFLQNAVGISPFAPILYLNTESIFLESFTTGTNLGWSLQGNGFVKTNGGTVSVANVFLNNCTASPANTFYATGSSTLTGTTTGWTLGAAPASPPSGGFIFF